MIKLIKEEKTVKTETDIYADQELTLTEAIAVVIGKLANGIPITGAREEVADDFIKDWADLFGAETAK